MSVSNFHVCWQSWWKVILRHNGTQFNYQGLVGHQKSSCFIQQEWNGCFPNNGAFNHFLHELAQSSCGWGFAHSHHLRNFEAAFEGKKRFTPFRCRRKLMVKTWTLLCLLSVLKIASKHGKMWASIHKPYWRRYQYWTPQRYYKCTSLSRNGWWALVSWLHLLGNTLSFILWWLLK